MIRRPDTHRNYETLDAIVVVACLVMVTGLGAGLLLLHDIPTDHLPIIASLVTAIFGLPATYGAFRWGNNVGAKQASETLANLASKSAADPQPVVVTNDDEQPVPVEPKN